MAVILRKTLVDWTRATGPAFMLVGPVRGAQDWQHDCYRMLESELNGKFMAYIPRRYDETHPLFALQASGDPNGFPRQTDAERYYISQAGSGLYGGCVIAWLPCEDPENPRPKEEGPYAQDTYGELGEIRGRMMHNPLFRFVLGAEKGFPGLDVMTRNFELALEERLAIHSTLEETVAAALKKTEAA
ncbi:MAG TPA: hypothetical protein VFY28_00025 [Candidatus Paceibacterota bacterium]|nr:hypothetical protein [Candidatus Paceibacterota bacterium]